MATIRFTDKPQLAALAGTEVLPGTSTAGGLDSGGGTVGAGGDIKIPLAQLAAFIAARRGAVTTINHAAAGALTIDYSLGDYFVVNLAANATSMMISNPPVAGGSIVIHFVQDATGGRTVALPAAAKAITGTDTVVQSAANARTVLHMTTINGGGRWEYSMKGAAP